jgi:phage-related tail fiber protein
MQIDGAKIMEGSEVQNLTVASGSPFPDIPNKAELFYLDTIITKPDGSFYGIGLYCHDGVDWLLLSTESAVTNSINSLAGIPTNIISDVSFPVTPIDGELFYKTASDVSGDLGLYVFLLSDSLWHAVSANTQLANHLNDQALHLTSAQNTWIDAITTTSTEVNYLSGVSSNVQSQLDSKANSSSLSSVATSGSYNDLTNKPTLVSTFTNDVGYQSASQVNATLAAAGLATTSSLATVATSGSYTDLINKPTLLSVFTNDSGYQTAANVTSAIQAVVGAAPAALDTLQEIADQLANDESVVAALTTTVSGKVTANTAIIAGTGTKITYDAKGLVTSSTSLSATDIPSLDWTKITTGKPTTLAGYGITDAITTGGTVASADKLTTPRTITLSSDITGSVSFDGSANATISTTLANSGVVAGTYKSVTVDAKGRVTTGTNPTTLSGYGITDAYTKTQVDTSLTLKADKATTLAGYGITDAVSTTGSAGSATKLATPRSISMTGDVSWSIASFDGSANVTAAGTLANSGATAGTYKSVTVDTKGRVTAGTNPTTLGGYGITDALLYYPVASIITTNVDTSVNPTGTTLDGIATVGTYWSSSPGNNGYTNNYFLLTNQTNPANNGLWQAIGNSTSGYMATSGSWSKVSNLVNRLIFATGGSNFGTTYSYTSANGFVKLSTRLDDNLTAIGALTGTTGILKKTAANTWTLDTTAYQTASDVSTAIQAVVGAAPAALDTLAEIAAQLANDESAVSALTTTVSSKASTTYVDTQLALKADKTALFSGAYADLTGKPTALSSFTNDAGYLTSTNISNKADIASTLAGYGITDAQGLNANLTSVAGLSTASTGLVKLTNGVASLDSSAYLIGNQSISVTGDATGSGTTAIALTLTNSGVTAGTYTSVTVDAKGRVTTGTNPTTLSGYGITDAIASSLIGAASGVAPLGTDSKIASTYLPSYVDDVLEGTNLAAFPTTGETGKIYVALDTNKTYRWSGSAYVEISASPGSTDSVTEGSVNLYFTNARAQAAVTTISGNAGTATKLATARTINGISFDGTANITINAVDSTARQPLNANLTSVSALSAISSGLVKLTNGVASLDSSAYLTANQSISVTGDATGSGTTSITLTLATITDSGTGSFKKVTVDTKGRVTGTAAVAQADITGLLGAGSITNTMLTNGAVANLSGTNTGDQTITLTGDVTGTGTGSFATTLANSGVTAGTYKSVAVDAKGRVTAGTNPTTLSGYGITDAMALVAPGTSGNVLTSNGTAWVSQASGASGATLSNDISTNTTQYLGMARASSGAWTTAYTASTKLYFNPSTGTLNSTNFNSLSDATEKTDVVEIKNGVETVSAIEGVEFNWISNGKKSSGVIAQQLESILPHLVETNDEGKKSVNYSGIIGYLISAVKELSEEVEKLKAK